MILADVSSGLMEMDTALLLAINGACAEWVNFFMYVFSGKWIWVPLYAAIPYVIVRNLHWRVAIGCAIAIVLTITLVDQIGAIVIRSSVCRLRPASLENPASEFVHIVNGYRGGRYGFPSCHAVNTFGLAFFLFYLFRNRALNWFIVMWVLLACCSCSYLGVHYPGDSLAGVLVGFAGTSLCYWLFNRLRKYERKEDYKHAYVSIWAGGATALGILTYTLIRTLLQCPSYRPFS